MNFQSRAVLGRTGLSVCRLGLASGYGVPAKAIEKAYHEHGINYFFWSTPRREAMKTALKSIARLGREKIVIAVQSYDHLGFFNTRAVDKALAALDIEYADILIMGWFNAVPGERILDRCRALIEKKKIRFVGMSGHKRKTFGALARMDRSPIDVFMVRYNAAHTGAESDIFPHLKKENRPGVTVYTATSWRKLLNQSKMPPGETPLRASDCYRFVLSNPNVDLCHFGPASEEQMDEGLTALAKGPLAEDEMARIRKIGTYVHG
jgi:Predicted oxidoreductases (related to aryl-alcohol dehydrogenases)